MDFEPSRTPRKEPGYRARPRLAIDWRGRGPAIAGIALAAVLILATLGTVGAGMVWRHLFEGMPAEPEIESLWTLGREPSIEVLARDGSLVGHRGPSYARRVTPEELPEHLVAAFLAAEDRRFFQHKGVDPRAIARAAMANLMAGQSVQGGSTITQQLVKNLVVGPERTLRRKAQEMRLALRLEQQLSKTEILDLYLNRVYLGERAFGVEAASLRYFGHSAREASLAEAALLAALPKAPTRLSPADNLEAARARAELVLRRMHAAGFIGRDTMQAAIEAPAELAAPLSEPLSPGLGYAFDEAARVARALAPEAPDLVVHTTLDPDLQRAADIALLSMLEREGEAARASQGALVALDYSGEILALAGGRDYAQSQFNRATQARRQPGSAFKPFVYAAAFEMGMRPATMRTDEPVTIGNWSPENLGGTYRGPMTLREAFIRSINTVAARVGYEVGPITVTEMARRLGVRTPLNAHPSIALGASEMTLLELTSAYGAFARDGALREPFLVTEITDTAGRVIWRRPEAEPVQIYEARLARLMTGMMRDVVRQGTGTGAALEGRASAGKTGTSQNYRDAWFAGYTGNLIAGVWVGNDDDSPMRNVTGGRLPVQVWRDFMQTAERGRDPAPLNLPPEETDGRGEQLAALYSELAAAFSRAAMAP